MITLNNGQKIPMLGLGTHRMIDPENATYECLKKGVRLIDTGTRYGNQEHVGRDLKKALENYICKREELFIVGK